MKLVSCCAVTILSCSLFAQSKLTRRVSSPVPIFVGHRYTVRYAGGQAFLLDFTSANTARFIHLEEPLKGKKEAVRFTCTEVGDAVYLLSWQEADKTTVVQVDDFKKMYSHTNITLPDRTFHTFTSQLISVDGATAMSPKSTPPSSQEQSNKQNVVSFYEAGLNKKDFALARPYLGSSYKQHNPNAADGIEGFKNFVAHLKEHTPDSNSQIVQVFSDGDYVILHVHKRPTPNELGFAIIDIFHLENGKIVEHWDVTQAVPQNTVSGNPMF